MFSTDDEQCPGDHDGYSDDFSDGGSNSGQSATRFPKNTLEPLNKNKGENELFQSRNVKYFGGPYQVDVRKPYKPIFICMVDLIVALTFMIISIMQYWSKLDLSQNLGDFK